MTRGISGMRALQGPGVSFSSPATLDGTSEAKERTSRKGGGLRLGCCTAAVLAFLLLGPGLPCWASPPPRILVLNSYHEGNPWGDSEMKGLRSVFDELDSAEWLYYEYMDTKRLRVEKAFPLFERYLREKYESLNFDVVLTCDNNALTFVLERREELFAGAPVVFCGVNNFTDALIEGHTGITGVAENIDVRGTLDLIEGLQPHIKRVVVISDDSSTGLSELAEFRAEVPPDEDRFEFVELTGVTVEELEETLMSSGEDTAVLHLSFFWDPKGRNFSTSESVQLVTHMCKLPVYCMWEQQVRSGALGGTVVSGRLQGSCAAEMVLRVLDGESPDAIPIIRHSPSVTLLNYDALKTQGIRMKRVPPESVVLGEPSSFYYQRRDFLLAAVSFLLVEGAIIVYLALSVVRRRRAETALRESESRYRTIFNTTPVSIWEEDVSALRGLLRQLHAQGVDDVPAYVRGHPDFVREAMASIRVVDVNDATLTMFGAADRDELLGDVGRVLTDESLPAFRELISALAEGHQHFEVESVNRRLDGRRMNALIGFTLPASHHAQRNLLLVTVVDITARHEQEEERRRLEAQVQQTQKLESLGVLAGGIAHDFNNLLVGVMGNAGLALLDVPPDSPVVTILHDIETAAQRAADLCKQMLAYSGQGKFVVQAFDLNDVIVEMEQLLRVSISKNVRVDLSLGERIPQIQGDLTQMRQIIMNLLTNASEAIEDEEGTVHVRTGVLDCGESYFRACRLSEGCVPGPYVFFEVADSGCGMDEATLDRIFDPFFSTKFTGRGLGLAAVLGIVRSHGGAIRVKSTPGSGTVFRVLMPAVNSKPAARPAPPARDDEEWTTEGLVLLVDDEPTVATVAERMLRRLGLQVVLASDGREGVERFEQRCDDIRCVLLDLTMPHMSGEETFHALRAIRDDVPIILSSGYDEQVLSERFKGLRVDGFVHKPYVLSRLRRALRPVLGD